MLAGVRLAAVLGGYVLAGVRLAAVLGEYMREVVRLAAVLAAFLVLFLRAVSHHVPAPTSNASAGSTVAKTIWALLPNCPPPPLLFVDVGVALDVIAEVDEVCEPLLVVGNGLVPDAEVLAEVLAEVVAEVAVDVVDDATEREYPSAA